MNSQDNITNTQWMNDRMLPQSEIPSAVRGAMEYRMVYPEIYYKIQPYVIMMCDEMDAYGTQMPSQAMLDQMTETIYDNVCRTHPELAEVSAETVKEVNINLSNPYRYGYSSRRRTGFLGDLINILLLTEIFGRSRRRYYY